MPEAKWYVAHTYSGYENKVAANLEKIVENRNLQDLIQAVKIPTEIVTEINDNGTKEVERKVFPGYVLVKMVMMDDTWYIVRNIRGVTGFVGPGSKPIPLTDEEVENLGIDQKTIDVNFAIGDSLRITDGPLDGFIGTVTELEPEKNRVRLIVQMFGKETPVDLELSQVETL
ncbi:MAG: transcription termination/antitermination protein NusG [Clostridia bacterium]|nr:transcription termination/antitermination protein NusG [Clostridia bacterium]